MGKLIREGDEDLKELFGILLKGEHIRCPIDEQIVYNQLDDDSDEEKTLTDTVAAAHKQMQEKQYAAQLTARGIPVEHIRSYGFAFEGKTVLIG